MIEYEMKQCFMCYLHEYEYMCIGRRLSTYSILPVFVTHTHTHTGLLLLNKLIPIFFFCKSHSTVIEDFKLGALAFYQQSCLFG